MITITPYSPADKAALLSIFRLNAPRYFDPSELAEFDEYLDLEGGTYLTVKYDGVIAGGAGYIFSEGGTTGMITWIFFHPDHSGKGLGTEMVEHCHKILRANPSLNKFLVRTSQLVYPFFERFGYKVVKTEKDYWAKGFDLVVMEREV